MSRHLMVDPLAAETTANLRALAANKRLSHAARALVEQSRVRRAQSPVGTVISAEHHSLVILTTTPNPDTPT